MRPWRQISRISIRRVVSFVFAGVALAVGLTGCGQNGPKLAKVTGVVTLDGKPVPGAVLTFIPRTPDGSPSYGATDQNGRYEMHFSSKKAGALLGDHDVEIVTEKISKRELAEIKAQGESAPAEYVAIPKKYRQPGALTASVADGKNSVDFPLVTR